MFDDEEIMAAYLAYRDGVLAEADKKVAAAEAEHKAQCKKIKRLEKTIKDYEEEIKQLKASGKQQAAAKADRQTRNAMEHLLRNGVDPKLVAESYHIPLKQVLQIQAALTP